jgi:hypothetical protein
MVIAFLSLGDLRCLRVYVHSFRPSTACELPKNHDGGMAVGKPQSPVADAPLLLTPSQETSAPNSASNRPTAECGVVSMSRRLVPILCLPPGTEEWLS